MHFHWVSAIKKGGFNHVVIYPSKKAAQYLNAPPIVIVWPTKIGALPSKIEDHLCIMIRNFNHQERWLHMFLPLKCLPHTKNNMYILYSFKIIVIIIMIIMININIIYIFTYTYTHTHIYIYINIWPKFMNRSNTNTKPVRLGGVLNYSIFNFVLFAFSKSTLWNIPNLEFIIPLPLCGNYWGYSQVN